MARVIESKNCTIKIAKQLLVDNLLNGVQPGVLASDIFDISLGQDPGTFIDVFLNPSTASGKTTTRIFSFTREDLVSEVLSVQDPEINSASMISDISVDPIDNTKILVALNRKSVAVY
jgi:hypothetical protein